jgi:hypothetical protein
LTGGAPTYHLIDIDDLDRCLDAVRGLPPILEFDLDSGELTVLKPGGPVAVVRRPAARHNDAALLVVLVEDISGGNVLARYLLMTASKNGDKGYSIGRFDKVATDENRIRFHGERDNRARTLGEAPRAAKLEPIDGGELAERVRPADDEHEWCGRTDRAEGEALRLCLSESAVVEEMLSGMYATFRSLVERDKMRRRNA